MTLALANSEKLGLASSTSRNTECSPSIFCAIPWNELCQCLQRKLEKGNCDAQHSSNVYDAATKKQSATSTDQPGRYCMGCYVADHSGTDIPRALDPGHGTVLIWMSCVSVIAFANALSLET
jgi:hypothetical protein